MGRGGVVTIACGEEKFEVPVDVISMSQLFKNTIHDMGTEEEIKLDNIKPKTFKKVIEYCNMHKDKPSRDIEMPLKTAIFSEVVSEEDYKFLDVDQESLFELILAANYLDIKPLLNITTAKVAAMIKGKRVEEIRSLFGIVNDFTPEQEAQIREENKWCEEA